MFRRLRGGPRGPGEDRPRGPGGQGHLQSEGAAAAVLPEAPGPRAQPHLPTDRPHLLHPAPLPLPPGESFSNSKTAESIEQARNAANQALSDDRLAEGEALVPFMKLI